GTLRWWDVATRQEAGLIPPLVKDKDLLAGAASTDGKILAVVLAGNVVELVDVEAKKSLATLKSDIAGRERAEVALSPDDKWVAAVVGKDKLVIWHAATGKKQHELQGHQGAIDRIAFSPDGKLLVSAGQDDNRVILRDVVTGKEVATLKGADPDPERPSGCR